MSDAMENKIFTLNYKVDLLKESVEHLERRGAALKAERDKLRSALEAIACMDIKSGSRIASVLMQRIAKKCVGAHKKENMR